MKPRTVRRFERICRIVTGSRSVPSPSGTPLYWAMSPETGTRANSLSNGRTVPRWRRRRSRSKHRCRLDRPPRVAPENRRRDDRPRAGELRKLSDERPDRTAGRGDDHGFSGLRLAEHAEPGRDRRRGLIELAQARAVRERVRPPSCSREDDFTFGIRGIVRNEYMRHALPGHHLSDLERRGIRLTLVHAAAHVRVEGEVLHLEQKLHGGRCRDRRVLEAEVGQLGLALRASRENDLLPTRCCHVDASTFSLSEMWARWAR